MMESEHDKVWRFMRLTGATENVAFEMLEKCRWETNLAVKEFNSMHADITRTNNNQQRKVTKGEIVHSKGGMKPSPKHTQPRISANGTTPQQVKIPVTHQKPLVAQPAVVKMPPPSQPTVLRTAACNQPGIVKLPPAVPTKPPQQPTVVHLPPAGGTSSVTQRAVPAGVSQAPPPTGDVSSVTQRAVPAGVSQTPRTGGTSSGTQRPAPTGVTMSTNIPMKVTGGGSGAVSLHNGSTVQVDGGQPSTNSLSRSLKRGLSRTSENLGLIDKARNIVMHDIEESVDDHSIHFVDTPEYTFVLPNLSGYSEDFRAFLHKDLIEMSTLVSLEQRGRLNWWADFGSCQRLLPLATTGDGNCLLHAASLGMWGFHDRLLTLRTALCNTTSSEQGMGPLYRRWRWHTMQANKQFELQLSESEWEAEWTNLIRLSSTKPRSHPGGSSSCCDSPATKGMMERIDQGEEHSEVFYESLEEFHVFVLAHVLRRPIIIVADVVLRNPSGEPLSPILFGGIYLPFECHLQDCHRSPLLLTYDVSHFSALVAMDTENREESQIPAAIPLVGPNFKLLPIHYVYDPGPDVDWNSSFSPPPLSNDQNLALLEKYLTVESLPILKDSDTESEGQRSDSPFEGIIRSNSCSSGKGNSDKDKTKLKDQIDSVTKSFGSIGKSMGQKLKKIGKAMKVDKKQRKSSVGSVTQSTNRSALDSLNDPDHILCAKLSLKRAGYQEQMITNYMHAAKQRFEEDRHLRQLRDKAVKEKAEQRRLSMEVRGGQCVNQGCSNVGTPETNYLCHSCYDQQRERVKNMQPKQTLQQIANQPGPFNRQDTLIHTGKSKFYTEVGDEHKNDVVYRGSQNGHSEVDGAPTDPVNLSRSSFYKTDHIYQGNDALQKDSWYPPSQLHASHPAQQPRPPPYQPQQVRMVHEYNPDRSDGPPPRRITGVEPRMNNSIAGRGAGGIQRVNLPPPRQNTPTHVIPVHHSNQAYMTDNTRLPCRNEQCKLFGTKETEYLCSKCYRQEIEKRAYNHDMPQKQTFI